MNDARRVERAGALAQVVVWVSVIGGLCLPWLCGVLWLLGVV